MLMTVDNGHEGREPALSLQVKNSLAALRNLSYY
jgi:hypothetical protein